MYIHGILCMEMRGTELLSFHYFMMLFRFCVKEKAGFSWTNHKSLESEERENEKNKNERAEKKRITFHTRV